MTDSRRQRRVWYVVGGVLVVAFLAFGATSFKSSLTPYVSFAEAMDSASQVQVAGALVQKSSKYVEASQELEFTLREPSGRTLPVVYKGTKPGNFEDATQVVAIGTFQDGAFHAEQLLVKCPSKYQGIEEQRSYTS